jgi:hypothetical protein
MLPYLRQLNVVEVYLVHLDEQYVELNLRQSRFYQHPINRERKGFISIQN